MTKKQMEKRRLMEVEETKKELISSINNVILEYFNMWLKRQDLMNGIKKLK